MVLDGAGPWKTSFMLTGCVMPSLSEADRRGAHRWATHRRKADRARGRRSPGETRAIAFEHIMSRAVESATGKGTTAWCAPIRLDRFRAWLEQFLAGRDRSRSHRRARRPAMLACCPVSVLPLTPLWPPRTVGLPKSPQPPSSVSCWRSMVGAAKSMEAVRATPFRYSRS